MEPVIGFTRNANNIPSSCKISLNVLNCIDFNSRPSTINFSNNGTSSAKNLIEVGKHCSSFDLRLYSYEASTFPSDNYIQLYFQRNKNLLGKDILSKTNCHFETVDVFRNHHALSICSINSITGVFRLNDDIFFLEYDTKQNTFSLRAQGGTHPTCETIISGRHNYWEIKSHQQSNRIKRNVNLPNYYQDYLNDVRYYVELVFIADFSVYQKYEKDAAKIYERLQSIASVVNSLYAPLNIRVTLVWADIWTDSNKIQVDSESDKTLARFVAYRKSEILFNHPHDNAHLITDQRFGEVIGKAYKGTMCSYDYSGGVIVDHSPMAAFVGGTVAHEMGHNFGMDHDVGYPDPCKCSAQQCIMAPSSSSINATVYFSDCSLKALDAALKSGVSNCLQNVPKEGFGGAKCGNGILEEGEECDCGSSKTCPNKCCIPETCKLALDALCADGDCCDALSCRPKIAATVCRSATNTCDLPEFCDGQNPICPPDFFVQNGHLCPDDSENICFDGVCGSRDTQCRYIWGPTGQDSSNECYLYNKFASLSGSCGYNEKTDNYLPCKEDDLLCGRLQCKHSTKGAIISDSLTAYNFVRLSNGREANCHTLRARYVGGKYKRDPGMVPNGAKCGDGKICVDAQCRNYTASVQMVSKCEPNNCNGKGICNNVGNCHCVNGYGGPSCDIPGYGGSLNSGPATNETFNPGLVLLYLIILMLISFCLATYYCKKHKNFWLHKRIWKNFKELLNIRSTIFVPVRRAPPIPNAQIHHTHRFSWNAIWNDSPSTTNAARTENFSSPNSNCLSKTSNYSEKILHNTKNSQKKRGNHLNRNRNQTINEHFNPIHFSSLNNQKPNVENYEEPRITDTGLVSNKNLMKEIKQSVEDERISSLSPPLPPPHRTNYFQPSNETKNLANRWQAPVAKPNETSEEENAKPLTVKQLAAKFNS